MKPVIVDKDFTASLEWADGRVWVHNEVHRYSKVVLRRLRKALEFLYAIAGTDTLWCLKDLHTMPEEDASKFCKYVGMMGFRPVGEEEAGDGTLCIAFKRTKN